MSSISSASAAIEASVQQPLDPMLSSPRSNKRKAPTISSPVSKKQNSGDPVDQTLSNLFSQSGAAAAPPSTPPSKTKSIELLLPSPNQIRSPMGYHTYDAVLHLNSRDRRGFKNKPTHTLTTDSAKKQAKMVQKHYAAIKNLQKQQLDGQAKPLALRVEGAVIEIEADGGVLVKHDGKERVFGMHETNPRDPRTKELTRQMRMYPKRGDGMTVLPGSQVLELSTAYNQLQHPRPTFQKFVANSVKQLNLV